MLALFLFQSTFQRVGLNCTLAVLNLPLDIADRRVEKLLVGRSELAFGVFLGKVLEELLRERHVLAVEQIHVGGGLVEELKGNLE